MKEKDMEMQKFAMADDEYDEYEEEVIDRDEEYDDEEGYDDEEYADEEGYDDEEYADEEGYEDDGYDDNYYDERLNKVLDELAELKRTVSGAPAPTGGMGQPTFVPPAVPYIYNLPTNQQSNGNEVIMYNEISRLRDELSKTQNTQNLHVELNRIKEEMERDRKFNESQYLSEIKRLNEKIETLQKNSSGPQSEDNGVLPESVASEGALSSSNFQKLIAINEAILKRSRSADSRVLGEISDVKKQLSAMNADDIARSVSDIKLLAAGGGIKPEDIGALAGEIAVLKETLAAGGVSGAKSDPKIAAAVAELKETAMDAYSDELCILRKLGELSLAVGCADRSERENKEKSLALIDEFLALKADGEIGIGDKLSAIGELQQKVSEISSPETFALAGALDKFASAVMHSPLDKRAVDELIRFADETAVISLSKEKRDALEKFGVLSQRLLKADASEAKELLPELLEVKEKLQDSVKQAADMATAGEIPSLFSVSEQKAKEAIHAVVRLSGADFAKYPTTYVNYAPSENKRVVSLLERTDDIIRAVNSINYVPPAEGEESEQSYERPQPVYEQVGASADEIADAVAGKLDELKNNIVGFCTKKQLDDSVAELKSQYVELKNQYVRVLNALAALPEGAVNSGAVSAAAGEAEYTNNEISDQLYNVRDELKQTVHDENSLTQDIVELKLGAISDIGVKLSQEHDFIKEQLDRTREAVEVISAAAERNSAVEDEGIKLYNAVCEQFDKLYEDVSTLLVTAENNISERVGTVLEEKLNAGFDTTNSNIASVGNALSEGMTSVNSSLEEIKNSLANSFAAATVSGAPDETSEKIDQIKLALDDYIAKSAEQAETVAADRNRLIESVDYLCGRQEAADAEPTVADRLQTLSDEVNRDFNLVTASIADMDLTGLKENVSAIKDTVDVLAADTAVAAINETVAELKESNRMLFDAVNENASITEQFRTTLSEDIAHIRAKLDEEAPAENAQNAGNLNEVYDFLNALSEKIDALSEGEQQDAQTVLNSVEDLKEQLHLRELEPSIDSVTDSEAEKQSLLNEIAAVRERLAGLEDVAQTQNEAALAQLDAIAEELGKIDEAVMSSAAAAAQTDAANFETLTASVDNVSANVDALIEQTARQSASLPLIADDVAQIKTALESNASGSGDNFADIMQTVNDMSDRVKAFSERMELVTLEIDSIPLVLSELNEVKKAVAEIKSAFDGGTATESRSAEENDEIARRLELLSDKTNEIIERGESGASDEAMREVENEIASLRENFLPELDKLKDDVAFIRNQIELNVDIAEDPSPESSGEDIAIILEDLAEIKEKLSFGDEGDSDALLEEIRTLKEELSGLVAGGEDKPTDVEMNMILSEIVSLRDEVQSYRDEMNANRDAYIPSAEPEQTESRVVMQPSDNLSENMEVILDELNAIRNELSGHDESVREKQEEQLAPVRQDISELSAAVSELKNILLRSGTATATESAESEVGESYTEKNYTDNVYTDNKYEEILSAIEELKRREPAVSEEGGNFDVLGEMLVLHGELKEVKELLSGRTPKKAEETDLSESETQDFTGEESQSPTQYVSDDSAFAEIKEELSALRSMILERGTDNRDELAEMLRDEIVGLRQELSGAPLTGFTDGSAAASEEITELRGEIAALREELARRPLGASGAEGEDEADMSVMTEILSLREEIAGLKEELATARAAQPQETDMSVLTEIMALREELAAMRTAPATAQPQESDMSVLTEIMALRDEIVGLKDAMSAPDSSLSETVEQIREDVRMMKDEPDLSALNEVLALRDEFQAMKDELAGRTGAEETKSNDEILSEVQSLRDQMFAISMANVNDGSTDKVTYESYNNIILDEITALREELNAFKANDPTRAVMDEIADIKASIAARARDESELMTQFGRLKTELQTIKSSDTERSADRAILAQLDNLKTELMNQREADLTSLNFMSEMAQLIERQNRYISQNSGSKISDEIESLKAEIASSLASPNVETSAILDELAKLKAEMNAEKPSESNEQVLREISRLKDEMRVMSKSGTSDVDADEISKSINDLRNELTQIADIVSDEEKPKKTSAKAYGSASLSRATRSSATRSTKKTTISSGGKRGRPKAGATAKKTTRRKKSESNRLGSDELLSKIDATTFEVSDRYGENTALDPNFVPSGDENLDIASKLAKQVANKLIMEQLVVQLGDGGVPEKEIDEIVRDILPMEFNTVQIEQQSDQVRRLANSLVLDKLRARLKGKSED